MITTLALVAALHGPPAWLPGPDKVKHFFASAFVHSASFAVARAAGLRPREAQAVGAVSSVTVGVWKEVRDRRTRGVFSRADLAWDAAGAVAAGALLNGTR